MRRHTDPIARPAATRPRRLRRLIPLPAASRRTRAPWGFLGMLALSALVEIVIALQPARFCETTALCWRRAADEARRAAPGRDVLFLGDSLVKFGLHPTIVESETGLRGHNLGVGIGVAPSTYFLFRRALDAGARPAAVVVDFKPHLMSLAPEFNLRQWQEVLEPREALELAEADRRARQSFPVVAALSAHDDLLTEIAVGRLVPSVRSRFEIRASLLAALRGKTDWNERRNRWVERNWTVNQGAQALPSLPAFDGVVGDREGRADGADYCFLHPVNVAFAERFFALAAARKVPVYWLLPPLPPQLQAYRERSGAEAGYGEFIAAVRRRHPEVVVIDARHSGYGPNLFFDLAHLNKDGARTLSRDVAAVLGRDLRASAPPASHWVKLPAYRPVAVPLEDVDESQAVLEAAAGG